jgi:hypothetical protein
MNEEQIFAEVIDMPAAVGAEAKSVCETRIVVSAGSPQQAHCSGQENTLPSFALENPSSTRVHFCDIISSPQRIPNGYARGPRH